MKWTQEEIWEFLRRYELTELVGGIASDSQQTASLLVQISDHIGMVLSSADGTMGDREELLEESSPDYFRAHPNLRNVLRFHAVPGRHNFPDFVYTHSGRLSSWALDIAGVFFDQSVSIGTRDLLFNPIIQEYRDRGYVDDISIWRHIWLMFLQHDYCEGLFGYDIPTPIKLAMSEEQRGRLGRLEDALLVAACGDRKETIEVVREAEHKETIGAQFTSYLDKVDGLMACILHLEYGNGAFFGPFLRYIDMFRGMKEDPRKLSKIQYLLDSNLARAINSIPPKTELYTRKTHPLIARLKNEGWHPCRRPYTPIGALRFFDIDAILRLWEATQFLYVEWIDYSESEWWYGRFPRGGFSKAVLTYFPAYSGFKFAEYSREQLQNAPRWHIK